MLTNLIKRTWYDETVTVLSGILIHQVTCREFSQCYHDVNICFWVDGSALNQSAAQTACQQRDNSFLPRITNSHIQSKLAAFRFAAGKFLNTDGFWIDVKANDAAHFHWIDGSPFSGLWLSTLVYFMLLLRLDTCCKDWLTATDSALSNTAEDSKATEEKSDQRTLGKEVLRKKCRHQVQEQLEVDGRCSTRRTGRRLVIYILGATRHGIKINYALCYNDKSIGINPCATSNCLYIACGPKSLKLIDLSSVTEYRSYLTAGK